MFFWFKSKPIVIDCFTSHAGIHDYFPIVNSVKKLPDWWKDFPSKRTYTNEHGIEMTASTIKRCDGILEYYKQGFMIPMWCDLKIKTTQNGDWAWRYSTGNYVEELVGIESHPRDEYGSMFDDFIHMKLISPWILREKSGVQFYWAQPFWNQIEQIKSDLHIVPAVVEFKHQSATHINFFLSKKESTLTLNAGLPLVHVTPLTDRKIDVRNHLVSSEEYKQLRKQNYMFSFMGKHKKVKKIMSDKKCPFGFGS